MGKKSKQTTDEPLTRLLPSDFLQDKPKALTT